VQDETMEKQPAHKLLRAWLEGSGRKSSWMAAKLGVCGQTFSVWLNGHRLPIMPYRREIARETNGAVPVEAWE